jgi:hypothetical protein
MSREPMARSTRRVAGGGEARAVDVYFACAHRDASVAVRHEGAVVLPGRPLAIAQQLAGSRAVRLHLPRAYRTASLTIIATGAIVLRAHRAPPAPDSVHGAAVCVGAPTMSVYANDADTGSALTARWYHAPRAALTVRGTVVADWDVALGATLVFHPPIEISHKRAGAATLVATLDDGRELELPDVGSDGARVPLAVPLHGVVALRASAMHTAPNGTLVSSAPIVINGASSGTGP